MSVDQPNTSGPVSAEAERLIDALLDGELTGDARASALRRLASEPAAAAAYVSAQRALRAVAEQPVPSFAVESDIMERLERRGVVRSRRSRRLVTGTRVAVAATVLLSVGAVMAVNRARPGTLGPAGPAPVTALSDAIAEDAGALAARLSGRDAAFGAVDRGLPAGAVAFDTGAVETPFADGAAGDIAAVAASWEPEPFGEAAALAAMLTDVVEGGGPAIVLASRPIDVPESSGWMAGWRSDGGSSSGRSAVGSSAGASAGSDAWLMGVMPSATVLPVTPASGAWRGGAAW